jgi:hypothetical protein
MMMMMFDVVFVQGIVIENQLDDGDADDAPVPC